MITVLDFHTTHRSWNSKPHQAVWKVCIIWIQYCLSMSSWWNQIESSVHYYLHESTPSTGPALSVGGTWVNQADVGSLWLAGTGVNIVVRLSRQAHFSLKLACQMPISPAGLLLLLEPGRGDIVGRIEQKCSRFSLSRSAWFWLFEPLD